MIPVTMEPWPPAASTAVREVAATCSHCRTVAGSSNGRWKGGRTRHKAGYVMILAPGHPGVSTSLSTRGIRVSDAIAWAQEILARYAGYLDTSNNAHGLP
jgi:hypothetical protein